MNKNLHYLFIACFFTFFGCISMVEVIAQTTPVLKHSYTFEDGTAADVVGEADGVVKGGAISDGVYTASVNGNHIELPAATIAINEYPSITLEAYITANNGANQSPNNNFTMLSYFGGSMNNLGYNGYFMSVARGDDVSRTAISTGTDVLPYNNEDGVSSPELEDGLKHHLISNLTNDSIVWYIDGERIGRADISEGRSISELGTDYALLAKGGYLEDPTWLGSIHEFNIYEGVMETSTIESRAEIFLADTEPTLSAITVAVGEETFSLLPSFSPDANSYTALVPNGTSAATITTTPTYESSTVTGDGEVTLVDGTVTAEILVTSSQEETMTYTVVVRERSNDASLSNIVVEVGGEAMVLDPVFDPSVIEYDVIVPQGTTSAQVTPTANQAGSEISGAGSISIESGKGVATIKVTAEDGTTELTYTVNLIESGLEDNATLQELKFAQGVLSPEFDPEITEYSLVVYEKRDYVNVFAKPTVSDAVVEGEAAEMTMATLNEDGTATVTIVVTAVDGETKKTYTVNITSQLPTAIGDEINSSLKVYPTVSNNAFNVEFGSAPGKITVYDLSGKVIVEKVVSTQKASVNLPKAGMYIFHLESKEASKTFKAFKID